MGSEVEKYKNEKEAEDYREIATLRATIKDLKYEINELMRQLANKTEENQMLSKEIVQWKDYYE